MSAAPILPYAQHGEGDQPQAGGGTIATAQHARRLWKEMGLPEVLPWQRLRRRAGRVKCRRQHPVAGYIADFYCAEVKLIVEIDGEAHNRGDRPLRDAKRETVLAGLGFRVLHVSATHVLADVDAGAVAIAAAALPLHRPAGGPPPHAMHGEDFAGAL
jgi:very-short-patch-repair endonuclease